MGTEPNSRKEIQIKCFGKLAIYVDGVEQSTQMNSMKARELIAFLLTYKGEAVHKVKVCEALWEDKEIERSKDCFYKLLKRVEKMPIPFIIKKSREMIQLRLDNVECDLVNFEQLMAVKDSVEKKEMAVALYNRGPLFEEENYNWICLKDGSYDYAYMEALDDLYEHYKGKNGIKAYYYRRLISGSE